MTRLQASFLQKGRHKWFIFSECRTVVWDVMCITYAAMKRLNLAMGKNKAFSFPSQD